MLLPESVPISIGIVLPSSTAVFAVAYGRLSLSSSGGVVRASLLISSKFGVVACTGVDRSESLYVNTLPSLISFSF